MKAETLLGLMVLVFAAVFILSGRPFFPANTPRVHEIALLPEGQTMAEIRAYGGYGSALLPYNAKEQAQRAPREYDYEGRAPVRIGWSFREVSFLKLPLWAYKEHGVVVFADTPAGFRITLLQDDQFDRLKAQVGQDYRRSAFPYWRFMWGWLVVAGFIAIPLLQLREHARWREAEGYTI